MQMQYTPWAYIFKIKMRNTERICYVTVTTKKWISKQFAVEIERVK